MLSQEHLGKKAKGEEAQVYSLPLKFIPVINLSFLIKFAQFLTAITKKSTPERGQPCLTPNSTSKNDVA